ncbi:MAG: SHOCT domain-containing protein [Lachnospiraceae bacterium]
MERKQVEAVENGANEVMYKMAEFLLKKMQENGLISEEEREKITVLNIETFSPELAKVYL